MLKYAALLLLSLAVFGNAYETSTAFPDDHEELTVAEFRDELKEFRDNAMAAAKQVGKLQKLTENTIYEGEDGDWEEVENKYNELVEEVSEGFGNEAERMLHLAIRLWEGPGDFKHEPYCDAVYNLAKDHEQSVNLEEELAWAFIGDLDCMKNALRQVKEIPFDYMIPGEFGERDAMGVLGAVLSEMHVMKESAIRFHEALDFLYNLGEKKRSEKKEVKKIMSILKRYMDKRKQ